jgi:uncharacterized protein YjbI with pentapeptide repeats
VLTAVGLVFSFAAFAFALWGWTLRAWLTERRLVAEFGADLYLPEEIANATRYYVRPDATSVDLAQEMEEGSNVVATREDLFKAVERFIDEESPYRHLLLLADAGMGKSSFVLNYYDHNRRRWWGRYKLAVIPLGHGKALEKVRQIARPKETILFLDAFDEDPQARADYAARLDQLMDACSEFRRVLITCRSQFFPKDASIPRAAGMVVAPRAGGARHTFGRLYLAPFSDRQVDAFLRRRYWFWQFDKKRRAREFARKVPKLTVRPMLLAHIPDLLQMEGQVATTWDIYEELTGRWYEREHGFWKSTEDLREFSEEVAVHFYLSFLDKGADRVRREEVTQIVEGLKVSIDDIDDWKATSRSLLHRDADGNWKFAHRSVMEFLFLKKFFEGDARCRGVPWTDQMKSFVSESILSRKPCSASLAGADLSRTVLSMGDLTGADLEGANLAGADLYGAVLSGAVLRSVDLAGANLSVATLARADLRGGDLEGANLRRAVLAGAMLKQANLSRANFEGAFLDGADFEGVDLTETTLSGQSLKGARFDGARLSAAQLLEAAIAGASLRGVNARGAKLAGFTLNQIDLSYAHLEQANLSAAGLAGARLVGAKLAGANLQRAQCSNADLSHADFREADLDGANLSGAKLERTNFSGARLTNVNLAGVSLKGVKLEGATLKRANLHTANLAGVNLSGLDFNLDDVDLISANLAGTNLSGKSFHRANLSLANLNRANLKGAVFRQAVLAGADLRGADLDGADFTGANLAGADLSTAVSVTRTSIANAKVTAATKLPPQLREVWHDEGWGE